MEEIIPLINKVGQKYEINERPAVSTSIPPGAFYATLDFSAFGLPSIEMADMLTLKGNVAFVPYGFGEQPQKGLQRASFATSIEQLRKIPTNIDTFISMNYKELIQMGQPGK